MTVNADPTDVPADRIFAAVVASITSMFCLSVLAALSKLLSEDFSIIMIIWARYVFAFVFMLIVFLPRQGKGLFKVNQPLMQIVRGLLLFVSTYLQFFGLAYLPLATAAAITLTSPIMVTALSWPMLREPVTFRLWMAIHIGFAGALIVVRPGDASFDWHVLFIVGSTACSALYQVVSRRYGRTERPDASATVTTIVGSVAASPFLPFGWVTPTLGGDLVLLIGTGVMAGLGHYLLTIAFTQAPAAIVSPFNYTRIIGAAILGYLIFNELPDLWTWVGTAVIILSGLYIGYCEKVGSTDRADSTPQGKRHRQR